MSELPFFYNRVFPTTWVHLSSLLTIAIFFKFSRLWSVRNLDLIALILVAPGLVAAQYGHANPFGGHRTNWLYLAVRGDTLVSGAHAFGSDDGSPPVVGGESVGRRADVPRHRALCVFDGQRADWHAGCGGASGIGNCNNCRPRDGKQGSGGAARPSFGSND